MSKKNYGTCFLCHQKIAHRQIRKHLTSCLQREELENKKIPAPGEKEKIFLIKVFAGPFWLYLEINGSLTLEDLDSFLRSLWLECCWHMSQFIIKGERYTGNPNEFDGEMGKVIHRILPAGTKFVHKYDFGSTTVLEGEVLSARTGKLEEKIRLLARNDMPEEVVCSVCQKAPDSICTLCFELYCEGCKDQHPCQDEEMMLPVVNSPRMGVCGYCGPNNLQDCQNSEDIRIDSDVCEDTRSVSENVTH